MLKKVIIISIIYIIGMFYTYGWYYTRYDCIDKIENDRQDKIQCYNAITASARIYALFWPLYWGGYAGYWVNSKFTESVRTY